MHVCPSTGGLIEQESRSTEAELGLLEEDKGARREDPTDKSGGLRPTGQKLY
jgi:hypothetical protein